MVVDLERDELPRQGVLAGFDEEVAFGVLDRDGIARERGEILLQFRAQGLETLFLCGERDRGEKGRQGRQEPFHNSTPSGMKAE